MKLALADIPAADKQPWVVAFGDDPHSWNVDEGEGSGLPGEAVLRHALQTFCDCWSDFDAETAARIFNLPIGLIQTIEPLRFFGSTSEHVTIDDLGSLIQALSATRTEWGTITVADVARLINQPVARVIEAVGLHSWMFLVGAHDRPDRLLIEHEGE
ncbi:hypothetical protein ASD39_15780 [Sphingomonas sp. Root50]|nr:hypothetical protein ASD17_12580 [Sphingomonas sp. Root1294]KQY65574.1 hypothetical protein ASD39_15780 [Sphingomonas sp. Root50]KRB95125.1 hypothetical protein ASE22_04275 [Sphingomonas sp. Root720]